MEDFAIFQLEKCQRKAQTTFVEKLQFEKIDYKDNSNDN